MGGSKINKFKKSKKKSESFSNFDHVAGSRKIQVCKKPAKKSKSFSSFDHVGSPKIQVCKKPVKEAGSFSCVDRPQKKIRIEGVESLDFDQKSDKDSSICESGMKNEVFSCNRPMKQIQDLQKLILWRGGVLRSLIENNIVERGSTVSYLCRKDGRVMKKGRVYEDGIKCDCCDHMFLLTKFELHAGSTNHRPAANLFFDDKRSILDCQTQLQLESVSPAYDDKSTKLVVTSTKSSDYVTDTNDDYCSFCNDEDELLLCDSCTSSFHSTCIGLDCVPDSDLWFCPTCVCQICHQGQPSNLTKEGDSKDNDLIKCAQCEHHFHISCLNKLGFQVCADYAKWLCTENCERIYLGLTEIRGKVIPLKGNNLNWSLLKYDENDTDVYELTKSYSKLIKALDVMHECFIPMKHPLSDKDIIEDVIFSRATKRSNFEGFYTAVLEKNDEIITVVTLRIHGYKVAEIPFVATTFSYRRLGMCRILMDVVERMIRGLGVERIVLPASTDKVSTWTRSFGFSEMTDIERRDLVECIFLEFLGTKNCLKKLKEM
ncbi:zinc finger, RING/FYVE/PHD-type, acyl-CoA N-acyltransferase, Jas TPL-binding domain protein [Tanacetum coccineum]